MSGPPELLALIRETIRREGPVSFAWFMEQALYHPQDGYYSSGRAGIGRRGDYFTNVSVGPLFGRFMAAQFAEMWQKLNRPNEFKIVEQGAHHGQFAADVLLATRESHAEFFAALRYVIIEPFPILKSRQAETLQNFERKMEWTDSLDQLAPFCGVYFSNELVDAFPVHLVQWAKNHWRERRVSEEGENFTMVQRPVTHRDLAEHLQLVPSSDLPNEYKTEVNLASLSWIAAAAQKLLRGFIIISDYGFAREDYYAPHRIEGTLRSYAKHGVLASPFQEIGESDLTAHVEWTSLAERAVANGLTSAGFADQHHFLTGLLAGPLAHEFANSGDAKTKRALQTLIHPSHLGMRFQFLVLAKDVVQPETLSGLRFARKLQQI